ncbi:LysR family transcriptional regulator [Advenella kashmirensis W13003]|uniref:LysR family transcriptional regulator n=1 Tax=Advenella kashmirensis W13003 TaxID=1424334 RepID=V8QNR9_9BURK|nr:LysR family transcriptional regulator [Advenella kashmirensis]ETF00624.1 LysR family transcriptional regulator [Advenella kashmirensis W13003]
MNLSLRQMRAFAALASMRNFTRAAEHCCITQSAFSALILNLERDLNAKLFSRNTRNVELTAEGEVFLNIVNHLMPETERALSEMQDHVSRRKGRVAIAALPTIFSALLPDIIATFINKYPGIELIVEDVSNTSCLELVRLRKVDFALCASAEPGADLIIEKLASDTFYFVCQSTHPLANRKRLAIIELLPHPIIVFETASSIRQHLDASVYPKQWIKVLQVNNLATAAGLVGAGIGPTIVPLLGLCQFDLNILRAIPVTLPINERDICLLRRKDATESIAAQEFIRLLRARLAREVSLLASRHPGS